MLMAGLSMSRSDGSGYDDLCDLTVHLAVLHEGFRLAVK
jgi:hypothetical protein